MDKKILLYVIICILVLSILILTFFPKMIYAIKDSGSSNNEDICSPPEGVSIEDWQTHMSHHPNIYGECF